MSYKLITTAIQQPVATITLNSPPLNIINIAMMHELIDAIKMLNANQDVHVIMLAGAGEKAFSAGVEIKEHTSDLVNTMLTTFHNIFRELAKTDKVTIASVHGHCLGGGCELACFCDFVVAEDSAKFGLPEIKLGCYPPVAAALFPELIGRKHAERLMISGDTITASEAQTLGLVTHLAKKGELNNVTNEVVASVTSKSASVIKMLRKSESNWKIQFLRQLDIAESVYLDELTKLTDMTEGIAAFKQKRPPKWSNK